MEIVAVLAAALVFYALTLAPTVVWGDSAAISLASLHGSVRLGTAGDHPLFILVAHFFTLFPGDPARNVNFASAMFGALTVALVYRCARQLTAGRLPAVIGAASLCVSHAFWLHSVIAEVYTANAFFLTATLTLLLDWHQRRQGRWLAAAGTVFVVGLTNHVARGGHLRGSYSRPPRALPQDRSRRGSRGVTFGLARPHAPNAHRRASPIAVGGSTRAI
jgi:hypothetical protein